MLRARLLDGVPSRTWVDKILSIMLALNAMAHEPHGFSASMVATGREPTLPPDLEGDACASPSLEDPASYVEAANDPTSSSCCYQPISRRKPHLRDDYSSRAY